MGYIVSSALCAYDHHFALLFAAIVGLTGILFLTKNNWKAYLLAGVTIFILYIPHLHIFFFQLNKGGLGGPDGWLAKPDENWFSGYLRYLFHYSYWMYGMLLMLLLLSIFFYSTELKATQKFRIIALFWFLLVFFIEYSYSIKVNPIIQYSTLIFVFPFFLIFLFSLFGELSSGIKTLFVTTILITGTLTLVLTRKHFQVFYKQPYQEQIKNTYKNLDHIQDEKNVTIELVIPPYYKEYYFKKYNRRFESIYYNVFTEKPNTKVFRDFVQHQPTNYFIAGNLPLEYIQIIKEKYPTMISKEEGFTYATSCFTKEKSQLQQPEHVIFTKEFELGNGKNKVDSVVEYSQAYTLKLSDIVKNRHAVINLSAHLFVPDSISNPLLVMDIQEKNQSISWHGSEYFNYNNNPQTFNTVYLSVDLTNFNFKKHPDAELKIYIWNKDKKEVQIDAMHIDVIKGNPIIYGLYEPID